MQTYIKNRITINTIMLVFFIMNGIIKTNVLMQLILIITYNLICFIADNIK